MSWVDPFFGNLGRLCLSWVDPFLVILVDFACLHPFNVLTPKDFILLGFEFRSFDYWVIILISCTTDNHNNKQKTWF
jgi:hypothetical protein